jgi:DegV family protein with EDD domain
MATRLVTDSACDLEKSELAGRAIEIVDLDVRLGEIGPETTRQWKAAEFWEACAKTDVLPETSAPSPGAFQEAFRRAGEAGADSVVCVTLSSKLSATYQAAAAAAEAMAGELAIEVVDSLSVTIGEGLAALDGLAVAEAGGAPQEVVAAVRATLQKIRMFATFDTLENLRKGGRIGGAQAFVGSLLSIKPVIEFRDGVVEPESRQRTRSRSLQYLADKARSLGPLERLVVMHSAASDVDYILDLLAEFYDRDKITTSYIGPVIGTHSGPGTIGVCCQLA